MNEQKVADLNRLVRVHSRPELIQMCKEKNLSVSGTKHDMAVRLIGGLKNDGEESVKLEPSINKLIIKKNANNQWEFEGLIFDNKTKNVIGVLDRYGSIQRLTRTDIEKCKQYKFKFQMPDVLDERPDKPNTTNDDSSVESDGDDEDDDLEEEDTPEF